MDRSGSKVPRAFKSEAARVRFIAAYDTVLRRWPVAYEELDLPTRLGATHVVVSGPPDALPLLLLPCFHGTATVWRPNVAALARQHRVYAVDVIGQAGKSIASRRIRSRRDVADWLVDLLDALGVSRTSIIGNSYGGFLALNLASLTPARVDRVVLINPVGIFASIVWKFVYGVLRVGLKALLTRQKSAPDIAAFLGKNVRFSPGDADWVALMSLVLSGGVRVNAILPTVFARAELRAIGAPTLLLIGDNEQLYDPEATLRRARNRMPGLDAELVPNAHHIAAMAQPAVMNERILGFLQRGMRQASQPHLIAAIPGRSGAAASAVQH
jgi:pimeloyl-ACP methyl ester carboxylesterase